MSRDETKQILMRIQSTFPNWKPQSDLRFVVETWHEYLSDYDYEQVKAALKAFVMTDSSGFAPSVGQLIEILDRLGNAGELSEMEAWLLVSKALRRSLYYADEEYAKLPEAVQKAVGSPEMLRSWAETDVKSIENVVQSNFMRTYRQELSRSRELRKIPANVRALLESCGSKLLLEEKQSHPLPDAGEHPGSGQSKGLKRREIAKTYTK